MYKSNFTRLVSAINAEAGAPKQNDGSGSILKSIYDSNLKRSESAAVIGLAAKSMSSLNRQLTPTRSEVIKQNRRSMTEFRKSLTASVRSNQLSSIDACRLEARANQLSTQLSQRGLI